MQFPRGDKNIRPVRLAILLVVVTGLMVGGLLWWRYGGPEYAFKHALYMQMMDWMYQWTGRSGL